MEASDPNSPVRSESSHANMTPEREMSYDSLRQEYESYKLKTKEWQSKVRDRDVKMRQQLQRSTDELHEKDSALNDALSKVAQLDEMRHHVLDLERAVVEAKSHAAEAQQASLSAEATASAAQRSVRQLESEADERRGESLKLKERIEHLQSTVATLQQEKIGNHVLFEGKGPNGAVDLNAVRVELAVRHAKLGSFAFVTNSRTGAHHWISSVRALEVGLTVPKSVEELAEERCSANAQTILTGELEKQRQEHIREIEKLRMHFASQLEAKNKDISEASSSAAADLRSLQLRAEEQDRLLKESAAAHSQSLAAERHRHESDISAAIAACDKKWSATTAKYEAKIKELEEYKSRAQLAMKGARPTASSDDREKALSKDLEQITLQLQRATDNHEAALREMREASARDGTVAKQKLQAALDEASAERKGYEAKLQLLEQRAMAAEQALQQQHSERTIAPQQVVTVAAPAPAPARVVHTATQCSMPTLSHVMQPNNGLDDVATSLPSPQLSESHYHNNGSDHFGTAADDAPMRSTAGSSSTAVGPNSLLVEQLRRECREGQSSIKQLQDALKRVSLREQHLATEEMKLREQLREHERSAQRGADFTNNFDYTKNVMLKVLLCKDENVRKLLIPVAAEVLHLSPSEKHELESSCK